VAQPLSDKVIAASFPSRYSIPSPSSCQEPGPSRAPGASGDLRDRRASCLERSGLQHSVVPGVVFRGERAAVQGEVRRCDARLQSSHRAGWHSVIPSGPPLRASPVTRRKSKTPTNPTLARSIHRRLLHLPLPGVAADPRLACSERTPEVSRCQYPGAGEIAQIFRR
jgi:hypothetical protein